MGVLPDLAAPDGGHGGVHAEVLRRAGGAPVRPVHRRLRLVLLPFHHHPRPRRHLDGTRYHGYAPAISLPLHAPCYNSVVRGARFWLQLLRISEIVRNFAGFL